MGVLNNGKEMMARNKTLRGHLGGGGEIYELTPKSSMKEDRELAETRKAGWLAGNRVSEP